MFSALGSSGADGGLITFSFIQPISAGIFRVGRDLNISARGSSIAGGPSLDYGASSGSVDVEVTVVNGKYMVKLPHTWATLTPVASDSVKIAAGLLEQ